MKRFASLLPLVAAIIMVFPLISSAQTFTYLPVATPLVDASPAVAKPVAVGPIAGGAGAVNIQVATTTFTAPMDMYLAILAPHLSTEIFVFGPDNTLQPASVVPLAAWKSGAASASASLFGDIPVSALPQGTYSLALGVFPANTLANGTLWVTSFTVGPPAAVPHADPLTTTPGSVSGSPASQTIGAAGGSLSSADGRVLITVPAGAVDEDTEFTITQVTDPADNAVATYNLEPMGLTLSSPVTLTFSAPEAGETRIGIEGMGVAYHDTEGHWQWLDRVSRDTGTKTLSVEIDHFSEYSMLEGFQLRPMSANVEVGESIQLEVVSCLAPEGGDDALAPLVCECRPLEVLEASLSNWSVNGVAGGNGTFGTVAADGYPKATFTAPSQQPDPETVRVTVETSDMMTLLTSQTTRVWLCSSITIGQAPGYSGQFNVSAYGPMVWAAWTAQGTATWTPTEEYGQYGEYTVNVTITPDQTQFVMGDGVCTLNQPTQTYENIGQIKDIPGQPTIYWLLNVQWSATCTGSGGSYTFQDFLSLLWSSGCAGIGVVEWAPLDDSAFPDNLQGSYTWPSATCTTLYPGMPTATATWDFVKQD